MKHYTTLEIRSDSGELLGIGMLPDHVIVSGRRASILIFDPMRVRLYDQPTPSIENRPKIVDLEIGVFQLNKNLAYLALRPTNCDEKMEQEIKERFQIGRRGSFV